MKIDLYFGRIISVVIIVLVFKIYLEYFYFSFGPLNILVSSVFLAILFMLHLKKVTIVENEVSVVPLLFSFWGRSTNNIGFQVPGELKLHDVSFFYFRLKVKQGDVISQDIRLEKLFYKLKDLPLAK